MRRIASVLIVTAPIFVYLLLLSLWLPLIDPLIPSVVKWPIVIVTSATLIGGTIKVGMKAGAFKEGTSGNEIRFSNMADKVEEYVEKFQLRKHE